MKVLLLNPGQMGSALGAALATNNDTGWVSKGRGALSRTRAAAAKLRDFALLEEALAAVDVVFSVVPPQSAQATAETVASSGFTGAYVDANAVSPATAGRVAAIVTAGGARYVDGGIIGPPPRERGDTRLYLAGPGAQDVAALLDGSLFEAVALDETPGSTAASSLKMAYAGWTKASSALLLNVRAMARAQGVEEALLKEWSLSLPDLPERSARTAKANAFKAWRFIGEMHEIADTMEMAGLPQGFHRGAAELWERLESYKDDMDADPQAVFRTLAGPTNCG
jgi:3-hydroxyisobutyrate dehydrogenase-like beta-hydroxyacid dehydrogenase